MIILLFIAIIYGLVEMFKIFLKSNFNNYIPFFAIGLGVGFSLLTYIFEPSLMPITNIILCLLFGILCGLASIGWNQVLKHIEKEIYNKKSKHYKGDKQNKYDKIQRKHKQKQVVTLKEMKFQNQYQNKTCNHRGEFPPRHTFPHILPLALLQQGNFHN